MFPYYGNTLKSGQIVEPFLPQLEKLLEEEKFIGAVKLLRIYMTGFWRQSELTELEKQAEVAPRLTHEPYDMGLKEAKELSDLIRDGFVYRQISVETREAVKRFRQLRQARQQIQDLYDAIVIRDGVRNVADLLIETKEELTRQMANMLEKIDL